MKGEGHRISVVGLGYVGLCTAATFASRGFRTVGIDVDEKRIQQINAGNAPIREPKLDGLLEKAIKRTLLEATSDASKVVHTGVTFLTVGTPSRRDGSIDLGHVKGATEELGNALRKKRTAHLVIVKSTVVPGTTNNTVRPLLEKSAGKSVGLELGLCTNPEFLKEGTAIDDSLHPDKIVIGTNDEKSAIQLTQLYKKFYGAQLPPVIVTSPETAELIKYASNAFLATKVSYINVIANIAQTIPGVDVEKVAKAIGHDPRIGPLFLKAGPGYGGSCFHKDLQALIRYSDAQGYDPVLLRTTEETNNAQATKVVELSEKLVGPLREKRIAVLGLAFKKDTDDVREAAALRVISQLRKKGARVVTFDPMAIPNAKKILKDEVEFAQDSLSALNGADGCIIMTEWDDFRKLGPRDYTAHMRNPNVVDARRIYDPEEFGEVRFAGIGLGTENVAHREISEEHR